MNIILAKLSSIDLIEQLKEQLSIRNSLKALVAFGSVSFAYLTMKTYFVRRKYAHIPGPKTNGYKKNKLF